MAERLTPAQLALVRDAVLRNGGSRELLDALNRDELTVDEREALGDLVTLELASRGFDADYRPTDLGRQLEDLIDVLADID